jgi:intracellular multiplication protein IcmW
MVDLTPAAVHKFWNGFPDKSIYQVIACMESMEDWTADGNSQLETALAGLGKELEDINNIDLKQEDSLIHLGAYLKTGRNLRILMGLDQANPGSANKVLMQAEKITKSNQDTAGLFLRRNLIFERLRLLKRAFAEDRIKLVQKCLEGGDDD